MPNTKVYAYDDYQLSLSVKKSSYVLQFAVAAGTKATTTNTLDLYYRPGPLKTA